MPKSTWKVTRSGGGVCLATSSYRFHLGARAGRRLAPSAWENLLTGGRLDLAGEELEVQIDSADRRLWIEGWRAAVTGTDDAPSNQESGYRQGCQLPQFDDSQWKPGVTPAVILWGQPYTWCWARTHLFIPDDCRGKRLTLVLGGLGVFDYRYTRVFINGRAVGVRRPKGRWFEPGQFDLGPASAIHRHLRFGQDNVIALQLGRQIRRTRKLDEFDPRGAYSLPWPSTHPGQYEQHVAVGQPTRKLVFKVSAIRTARRRAGEAIEVHLRSKPAGLAAAITYHRDRNDAILHRCVRLTNTGRQNVRLMSVQLGCYRTSAEASEGYMGMPVYLDGEFFISLDHPAGWVTGQDHQVSLRQYPGRLIAPGGSFDCMNSVLGVAGAGGARRQFVDHVRARMRRVVRGHDKPLAIFETFGGWPYGPKNASVFGDFLSEALTEDICLHFTRKLKTFRRETGQQFDVFGMEFWCDPKGDVTRFKPQGFPRGFGPLKRAIEAEGMAPGLWIATSSAVWNIGLNPAIARCRAENPAYSGPPEFTSVCLADEPLHSMLTNGLRHHVHHNGARMVKLDGTHCLCYNTSHDHLPGLYSTEAIYNACIRMLRALDRECPELFIILYWGCHSPWWLLHGDTIFEPGLHVEAASPSPRPSLYARDGVTVGLDQAQEFACDIPPLGKDSLGVWLSDWPWNSSIGKQRWQEGMVMDLCRGSLLLQPWTDYAWLSPPQRRQFGHLLQLLRQRPECFANPRFILASPRDNAPYGYCCTDGRRAFLAISNPTWNDALVRLQLGPAWGLASAGDYQVYRHYPEPARLSFGTQPALPLRPFDTVLLEAVPRGEKPSGQQRMPPVVVPRAFDQASLGIPLRTGRSPEARGLAVVAEGKAINDILRPVEGEMGRRDHRLRGTIPPCPAAGVAVVSVEIARGGRALPTASIAQHFAARCRLGGKAGELEPVLPARTYPAAWQAWRLAVGPSSRPRSFEVHIASVLPADADLTFASHFLPR